MARKGNPILVKPDTRSNVSPSRGSVGFASTFRMIVRWLFSTNRDIGTFNFIMFKNQTLFFFFQIGFCVFSFLLFLVCYNQMFPSMVKGELPNPPQVIAQLFSFFFLFKYTAARERHLLLLCLFFSFSSSVYLKGQGLGYGILFLVAFCLIIIYIFPLDSDLALFVFFAFYCFDVDMSKWGFYLIFQQFCFFFA